MHRWVTAVLVVLVLPAGARPTTYLVTPDGSGDFPTIQAAINESAEGDTVELASGVFVGPGNRDIDFLGKGVVVRSRFGNPDSCVVDCQGSEADPHIGFLFVSEEGTGSILEGISIINGYAGGVGNERYGGAIRCGDFESTSSPTIVQCVISRCHAVQGGGIACFYSAPSILRCKFTQNTSESAGGAVLIEHADNGMTITESVFFDNATSGDGGAVNCIWSSLTVTDCRFEGNSSWQPGGAIRLYRVTALVSDCVFVFNGTSSDGGAISANYSSLHATESTFARNYAGDDGGGMMWDGYDESLSILECTFHENLAESGGGIYLDGQATPIISNSILASSVDGGGLRHPISCEPMLSCCDIYGNYGGDWVGGIADQYGIRGNFSADPCFCDVGNDDFHLWNYSPCNRESSCGLIGALGVGCWDAQAVDGTVHTSRLSVWPNPVVGTAHIRYGLPVASSRDARLNIYDPAGRLIRTLTGNGGTLTWDATDAMGRRFDQGVYFFRLRTSESEITKRVVIIR
ncbi:T9SS type A sorting domain-containing protein [Candidatus Eisenbacteria bacterium]|uniref:T9SS type A sorting domain-containing protein n=1 Tax=Eiseniibacteriota bacterium TaxID=2212470 RepID=A0ABV6YL02_UNCEI